MDNADRIQAVINTLDTLMIPATYDNVNRVLGIYNTLAEVRDDLRKEAESHAGEPDIQ